jgi:hypothetical protein
MAWIKRGSMRAMKWRVSEIIKRWQWRMASAAWEENEGSIAKRQNVGNTSGNNGMKISWQWHQRKSAAWRKYLASEQAWHKHRRAGVKWRHRRKSKHQWRKASRISESENRRRNGNEIIISA